MARRNTTGRVVPGGLKFNERTGYHEPVGGLTKVRNTAHFTKWDQDAIVMSMYAALHPEEYARAFRASGKTANSFKMGTNVMKVHLGLISVGLTGLSNLGKLKVTSYLANPNIFDLEAKEILRRKENGTL